MASVDTRALTPSTYACAMASVVEQILEWSATRPMWQRDALRRLVIGDVIDEVVVNAYASALESSDDSSFEPIAAGHLGTSGSSDPKVTITGISSSENVNRLAQDDPLTFAEAGLTIVYGDNGSGKSGYARILKSVTRTRAETNVRNDIFSEGDPTPTADIGFSCDGVPSSFNWASGQTGPDEIARASFFDRACADTYLSKNTDVAYSPAGLDLFDSLDSACKRVREVLDARVQSVGLRGADFPDLNDSTPAGAALTALTASTPNEVIDTECALSDRQRERLAVVQQATTSIATGTATADADRLRRLRERLERVGTQLETISAVVSPAQQTVLVGLRVDAESKAATSELARTAALGTAPLAGVGGQAWRALWEAARQYSAIAYPNQEFPVVNDSVCVLCQQDIDDDTADRFRGFDDFVRDTTQRASELATKAWNDACQDLDMVVVGNQITTDFIDDLRVESPETATAVEIYLEEANNALVALKLIARDPDHDQLDNFPTAPTSALEGTVIALGLRESELRDAAGLDGGVALRTELIELQARKDLASAKTAITRERDRLRALAALTKAKRATSTNAISEMAASVTDEVVTEILVDRFTRETERLGLENVVLRTVGGRHGVLLYRTGFVGAQHEAPLPEVLSEGEQTALGLAGYLAELATDASQSTAIFDDPVSSLDHERRDKVAGRLVQLAKGRQTIVFTHDVAFVLALKKHALHEGIAYTERTIERLNSRPGHCTDQHKFSAKLVSERITEMKADLSDLRARQDSIRVEEYRARTGTWYKQLRKTWERAIEEVVVGEILTRDDLQVHPKMVRTLVLFSADDNRELQYGYGRATELSEVHDESPVINSSAPSPDDLAGDLTRLEDWHKRVSKRRNLTEEKIYALASSETSVSGTPG